LVRLALFAGGIIAMVYASDARAELFRDVKDKFENVPAQELDEEDKSYIEQRGNRLRDPKAVVVWSMHLACARFAMQKNRLDGAIF
jgi:hypothetical protein